MNETIKKLSELLHEVAELHHQVYKITDGDDPDWAIWYAHWLIHLSNFSKLFPTNPIESEVIYLFVKMDKEYTSSNKEVSWEIYYAEKLLEHYKDEGKCLACGQLFRLDEDLQKHIKEQHA